MELENIIIRSECSKTFTNVDILIQHIKHFHLFLQSYICKQNNCHRTFPHLSSFKKHLIKNHAKYETAPQSDTAEQIKCSLSNLSSSVESQNVNQNVSSFSDESHICSNACGTNSSDILYVAFSKVFRMLLFVSYRRYTVILLYHEILFKS